MNLDIGGAGAGGISGLVIAIISILGFKNRVDKLEGKLEKTRSIDTCEAMHNGVVREVTLMRDDLKGAFERLHERLDKINNGKP